MTTQHQQPPPVSQRRDAGRVRVAATTPGTRRPTRQPDREQRHTGGRGVGEVVTPAASTPSECARRPTITKPAKSNRFTSSTTASRFPLDTSRSQGTRGLAPAPPRLSATTDIRVSVNTGVPIIRWDGASSSDDLEATGLRGHLPRGHGTPGCRTHPAVLNRHRRSEPSTNPPPGAGPGQHQGRPQGPGHRHRG
jgi:hypothetical protein